MFLRQDASGPDAERSWRVERIVFMHAGGDPVRGAKPAVAGAWEVRSAHARDASATTVYPPPPRPGLFHPAGWHSSNRSSRPDAIPNRRPGHKAAGYLQVPVRSVNKVRSPSARKQSPFRTAIGCVPAPRKLSITISPRPVCSSKTRTRRPLNECLSSRASAVSFQIERANQPETSRASCAGVIAFRLRADPVTLPLERIRRQADASARFGFVKAFPIAGRAVGPQLSERGQDHFRIRSTVRRARKRK